MKLKQGSQHGFPPPHGRGCEGIPRPPLGCLLNATATLQSSTYTPGVREGKGSLCWPCTPTPTVAWPWPYCCRQGCAVTENTLTALLSWERKCHSCTCCLFALGRLGGQYTGEGRDSHSQHTGSSICGRPCSTHPFPCSLPAAQCPK